MLVLMMSKRICLTKGENVNHAYLDHVRKEITWLSSSKRGKMWMYDDFDDAKEESNKAASNG